MYKQMTLFLSLILLSITSLQAQNNLLRSGPMLGYSQMREAAIWVQTVRAAEVKIKYWTDGGVIHFTDGVFTEKSNAFTAHLIADEVEPGIVYNYELFINDEKIDFDYPMKFQTQELWQWRHDPPEFNFAAGSGAFINEIVYDRPKPYGGDYKIFESIADKQPDFMLWLGDNCYLREADYFSRTGILKRMTHTRSTKEMQKLLATAHNYAIWDDHDFGPDNSDRSFWNKETTLEAFKLFWANPSYGINGKPGTTTFFQWGDAEFFLLDNRYYRSPNDRKYTKREILGDEQIQWLIDALSYSKAPFKFIAIGGQFLNPVDVFENHATYPEERAKILKLIELENIPGVIFLTGDRHFTEITKLERKGTYPLYDFTISPFTSGANTHTPDPNYLRVEGTLVQQRNFAVFNISGPRQKRELKCTVFDIDGKKIWDYSINENELK